MTARGTRAITAAAWTLSLVLHGLVALYVAYRTTAPDLGFELELPETVEFGLTDAVQTSAGASAPPPAAPPPAPTEPGPGPGAGPADAGVPSDAGPADAGRRPRRDAGSGAADAGVGDGEEGEGQGVAFLPAGSQIALRLDVARLRASPLADDVRGVLGTLPDWQALLAGSGVDPLTDFDRLLIASPNLQRSRLIAAGRVEGDRDLMRAAASRMALAAGQPLTWRTERGVEVAEWHDPDETERVVALVGPQHFTLCRPEDLPRVLAVARARARDRSHPADALLSMEPGEGLSLEVEGARSFARASPRNRSPLDMVPTRLRLSLSDGDDGRIQARTRWTFDDPAQAAAAARYWDNMRGAYARNVITAMLGISPILERATIDTEGATMRGNTTISMAEMSRLLGLVRAFFADRARRAQEPGAPAEPEAPAPPAPAPREPAEPPLPVSPYE
ncbi:MAG: hypothetical protein IT378_15740 [Sandaracinaceae bacterium]|nr:hypothetical protein [Sandaracinaceae bacterium]